MAAATHGGDQMSRVRLFRVPFVAAALSLVLSLASAIVVFAGENGPPLPR
jgi:hypothetical protein